MTRTSPPARHICVLPGLAWPAPLADALPDLPGLRALIGLGETGKEAAQPYESWLAARFGAGELPLAALRNAGEDTPLADEEQHLLCADPVSLNFARDALLLTGPAMLDIRPGEAEAMIATLNEQLADVGHFHAATPARWYLRTPHAIGVRFVPLGDVLGRPAALFQPEGDNARFWARINNEMQVILHNHPVNVARIERGAMAINAAWLWGASAPGLPALGAPADCLVGDDPLLRGLAAATRTLWLTRQQGMSAANARNSLVWWHDTRLHDAALYRDTNAWLAALTDIDTSLLQPLVRAQSEGRLAEVRVWAPSERCLLTISLQGATRWRFWRRPASPAALTAHLIAP